MFKLLLVKNDGSKTYDITPLAGTITWDSNLSLMSVLEYELFWNDTALFPINPCELGDVVILLKDDEEVYRGIIVTESRPGWEANKYTVYDYAWYLGKSKSVYQFNNLSASKAIERILKDFGMLIGSVPEMNTPIDEIYLEKSPAEIIDEILKKHERRSGKRYTAEMRKGKIYFEEMADMVITGTFQLAGNIAPVNIMASPLAASKTRTIESLRNQVKILVEHDKDDKAAAKYEVVATAQDEESVTKYGLLEDVYKIDAEDAAKAREVARILLQRLNRIHETNSIKLLGDVVFKAGRLLDVDEPITGMSGRFMIVTAKHTVSNQIHMMDLELALPEEVN